MGDLHNLSLSCSIVSVVKLGWFGGWRKEEMLKNCCWKTFQEETALETEMGG
jgi:hypothetical protein